jgi:Mg2+ and Co2+ transporter CorA
MTDDAYTPQRGSRLGWRVGGILGNSTQSAMTDPKTYSPEEVAEMISRLKATVLCHGHGEAADITDDAADMLEALAGRLAAAEAFIANDADWKFSAKRRLELFRQQRARAEAAEARVAELETENATLRANLSGLRRTIASLIEETELNLPPKPYGDTPT